MELSKIVTIEIVILGFLILLYGFVSCNQGMSLMEMDFKCYLNYAMLAVMVLFGGVAIAGMVIRGIEKRIEKKRKKEEKIEIPWR